MGNEIVAAAGDDEPRGWLCRLIKWLAEILCKEEHPKLKVFNDILVYYVGPIVPSHIIFSLASRKAEREGLQGAAQIIRALALVGGEAPKGSRMIVGLYTLISLATCGRNIINQKNANFFVSLVAIVCTAVIAPIIKAILEWLCGRK